MIRFLIDLQSVASVEMGQDFFDLISINDYFLVKLQNPNCGDMAYKHVRWPEQDLE